MVELADRSGRGHWKRQDERTKRLFHGGWKKAIEILRHRMHILYMFIVISIYIYMLIYIYR